MAFSAYIDSTTSLSTDKTVFNRVLINEHQAYDQSTGVFTCPISGVYMFSFVAGSFKYHTILQVKHLGNCLLTSVKDKLKDCFYILGNN